MAYNGGPPPSQQPEPPHYYENGRFYGSFRKGQYLFPVDEDELDRLDIFHKFFQVARQGGSFGGLHQHQLPTGTALRILDLGCGTGIWTIDMADKYPTSTIVGLDLNFTQPQSIPNTIEFRQQDITEPDWHLEQNSFDLVHLRMLAGCIKDWSGLYRNIFRHLKPETGIVEHIEIDFRPESYNNSLPADSSLRFWANELYEAFERTGQSMIINPNPEVLLKQAGFVNIEHTELPIPYHAWPVNEREKEVGRWFNLGMNQGLVALSMAPLTRIKGYSKDQVLQLTERVRREICTRALISSCTMHIWTATKPPQRNY
ncbi:methyltransferase LaeA [Xylariales sp. PMI_506]|nr:methyltransferase LaeA [Xylariales sp. PMI_506]